MLNYFTGNNSIDGFFGDYKYIYIPMLCWGVAQAIKGFIAWRQSGKFKIENFFASGGMPSSHTSFVFGLVATLGYFEGITTPFFAVSLGLALIVSYDAYNVRLHAGKGIKLSKSIINTLRMKGINVEVKDKKIKEVLGHRKIEVGGGMALGVVQALIICLLITK